MLYCIFPFGPQSLRWLLLCLLTQVTLISASPKPAGDAVDNGRTLYPKFPQTYPGRVEKGFYLLRLLPVGNEEAQKLNQGISTISRFQDYKDLERWGWRTYAARYPYDSSLVGGGRPEPWFDGDMDVFKDPVFPVIQTENISYRSNNDVPFKKELGLPSPSDGFYQNTMNPTYGAIIFDVNWSPRYSVSIRDTRNVPDLNALSDVIFLQWLHACKVDKVDPKKLKLTYRLKILSMDTDTNEIIEQALRKAKHKMASGWDNRKVFTMDESEGAAILGSTHGAGVAWMLIQHKEILGIKTITEVAVWQAEDDDYFNLRFIIKDV
ncbi:hypothetical protein LY78DRAFT_591084 [Colletotrichum sublineola]|nr:hypothetical protein LY78DRAFT_591084 [Colletotrichum sublineola]